ncbi:class I SAM-dependent DNA methyltransferase [Bacillus sp. B-jedd]|uniref:class I SAM-dependent DNA methyltransferase n=1 Tax=Bacillus sp. B-jedd TaxID=1476857 RepID=UPI0005155F1F|nr:class I SAM-dependent methyltransferase [Bacillus sp. B-jedd]CEG27962.1 S-adenosylmethionine(SAM)-dependent methyltransferase [Bacillus sp. B-jedd]
MGREFLELFEVWADTYDQTVDGHDREYEEVFNGYETILDKVAAKAIGHVVEFGLGTGNLTTRLLALGHRVTGIEPSPAMRQIADDKLGGRVSILDGDFLQFPELEQPVSFVSTYAFHHLTDLEKQEAIALYGKILPVGGKIVFADTMYVSEEAYNSAINEAKSKGFHNLAADLEREYYTTIPVLQRMLEENGFHSSFTKCNEFVWLMEGIKNE